MIGLRKTGALLRPCAQGWSPWIAVLVALAVGPCARRAGGLLGPWFTGGGTVRAESIGWLFGLYMGFKCISHCSFALARSSSGEPTRFRFAALGLHVGGLGAAAWLGAGGEAGTGSSLLALAWGTVVITAVATGLAPHLRGPGRSSLATVALAWWIPAVLPPSFLFVVPRALRGLLVVGPQIAVPSEPAAWMADTALVVGLLLLAWAPRRATPRGDEVRHPG
jgi:hypothetical protein